MSPFIRGLFPQALQRISGGALLLTLMAAAALSALALSASILSASARTDADQMHRIGERLQEELRDGGLSGLSQMLVDVEKAAFLGDEPVEVAVWRLRPGGSQLHRATSPAFVEASATLGPGSTATLEAAGRILRVEALDIRTASRDWPVPMADVAVAFGVPAPSQAVRTAWTTIGAVWTGLGVTLAIGLLLHANHTRRYRDGLIEINAILESFSAGNTAVRLPNAPPAPELRALAHHVNAVLPRIDELITGLRYLSAHMAHEMKTPLQRIRGELSRLLASSDAAGRDTHALAIETTIDDANGRLHSLMQLFRLESLAPIALTDRIDLGCLTEYAVDDIIDALERNGRTVVLDIARDVQVTGNRALVEVLVSNLLGNANKYAVDNAEIRVTVRAEGDSFMLSVANTGSSFAPDVVEHAFELFSRGSATSTLPGVGIGLSLVKAISQRHGFRARITPSASMAEVIIQGPLSGRATTEARS
ncbi:sensor histidine kinase [Devosia sp. Root635]|uniref:sensor histidine kinase n=1 Tax=Devosia sp. Root635 TaxID=1736575 RepID=UPI0006F4F810|nr:HAMP domain-containing sensor histidine kinase [Devosia sp. Root635]KRA52991.1 hypothetical protein ASD80_14425 [Devosia sp. Root635]